MTESILTKAMLQPMGDRVLIKPVEEAETMRRGILIPETAKEKPQEGRVEACGKGKVTEEGRVVPMSVKPGDRVLFAKYSGSEIIIDEKNYLIMGQDDIIGILKS